MNIENPKLVEERDTLSPLIDKMLEEFYRELEKLPPPPPGYYYYPDMKDIRQEGDAFVVDSEIKLRQIISVED